ncbi:hypothetical protein APICC_05805 [Apis cerana cerana]|uniref:Uncharacterized protein n=1 Tax=Apis cerana cerana TaxID=94128 RepID=A0A2A3EJX7_APICC|nr:hypothetical protein APICC_05805 [Apis cerana cerana]
MEYYESVSHFSNESSGCLKNLNLQEKYLQTFIVIILIEKENSEDIAGIMIISSLPLHVSDLEQETNGCT